MRPSLSSGRRTTSDGRGANKARAQATESTTAGRRQTKESRPHHKRTVWVSERRSVSVFGFKLNAIILSASGLRQSTSKHPADLISQGKKSRRSMGDYATRTGAKRPQPRETRFASAGPSVASASSSPSKTTIGVYDAVQSRGVATRMPTSPASMSPSSLFDYQAEDEFEVPEDDEEQDGIRGWLSETSRELRSSEIPSSHSPREKARKGIVRAIAATTRESLYSSLDDDDEQDENRLLASPTLQTNRVQRRKLTRSAQSLPIRSKPLLASAPSSGGSHGGLLMRTSSEQVSTTIGRPATPSSSRRGRSSNVLARPQSAMKHRSANEYSSGKNVPVIVISSGSLPRSVDEEDELDDGGCSHGGQASAGTESESQKSAHNHATSLYQQRSDLPLIRSSAAIASTLSDSDSAFSPSPVKTSFVKRNEYTLHSAASLPKNSFYARAKKEEGSPTPMRRKRVSPMISS